MYCFFLSYNTNQNCQAYKNKKTPDFWCFIFGGGTGTRTLDPMIKSHLLYQLSYASKTELFKGSRNILT